MYTVYPDITPSVSQTSTVKSGKTPIPGFLLGLYSWPEKDAQKGSAEGSKGLRAGNQSKDVNNMVKRFKYEINLTEEGDKQILCSGHQEKGQQQLCVVAG